MSRRAAASSGVTGPSSAAPTSCSIRSLPGCRVMASPRRSKHGYELTMRSAGLSERSDEIDRRARYLSSPKNRASVMLRPNVHRYFSFISSVSNDSKVIRRAVHSGRGTHLLFVY
jgi:hypothetical protein